MTHSARPPLPKRAKRPPVAAGINWIGRGLKTVGYVRPALSIASVKADAEKQTGLSDYDGDSYMAALEPLLWGLEHEANLNQLGRMVMRGMIVSALASRLTVVDWEKSHPEAARANIKAPLIVFGMPRTGTTILYETLAADPRLRAPLTWECRDYALAHAITDPHNDKRITKFGKNMARMDRLMPGFSAIHYFDPFIPTECVGLTILDMASEQFPALAWLPSYRNEFLLKSDFKSAYNWHRRALRYFQATTPEKQWVLKTPLHSAYLGSLLEAYPDACLIHTHREPMQVIASVSSLCHTGRSGWSDHVDTIKYADHDARYIAEITRLATAFRASNPHHKDRFLDIAFKDFITQPKSVLENIHAHFNRDLPETSLSAMLTYLENRPRHKYGVHKYTLEDYGLSETEHGPLFAAYRDHFQPYL